MILGETPIDELVLRWADDDRADRAALVEPGGTTVSYRRLAERVRATAAGLVGAGVEPGAGARVGFCGLNRIELFEVLLACARLGAALTPVNNRLTPPEVARQLADAEPSVVVTTDGFGQLVAEAGWPSVDLDTHPLVDPAAAAGVGAGRPGPAPAGGSDHPLLIVYTSGTTGAPKGAVLTQRAVAYTCANGIDHQDLTTEDRVVAPLPLFHVGGIAVQTLPTLVAGGTVVLHRRFDPGEVLTSIPRYQATQALLVPAMLTAVAGHPAFAATDLGSLVGITTGSSIVPSVAMEPFFERGIPVGQVYGTTETGPTSVVLRYDEAAAHIGSCGRPATHTEVRVVDRAGEEAPAGHAGEILLRGPNVFSGYWRNEVATAEAFTADGWYRTGDVGHVDADGYLVVSDRLGDLVISGGENVYPAEVEAVVADHPAIAEVAVIGRPDERWGEAPVAAVVLEPGQRLDGAELRSWCEGRLARFKQPRDVIVVDDMPRTALGKVRKNVLREQVLGVDAER